MILCYVNEYYVFLFLKELKQSLSSFMQSDTSRYFVFDYHLLTEVQWYSSN